MYVFILTYVNVRFFCSFLSNFQKFSQSLCLAGARYVNDTNDLFEAQSLGLLINEVYKSHNFREKLVTNHMEPLHAAIRELKGQILRLGELVVEIKNKVDKITTTGPVAAAAPPAASSAIAQSNLPSQFINRPTVTYKKERSDALRTSSWRVFCQHVSCYKYVNFVICY